MNLEIFLKYIVNFFARVGNEEISKCFVFKNWEEKAIEKVLGIDLGESHVLLRNNLKTKWLIKHEKVLKNHVMKILEYKNLNYNYEVVDFLSFNYYNHELTFEDFIIYSSHLLEDYKIYQVYLENKKIFSWTSMDFEFYKSYYFDLNQEDEEKIIKSSKSGKYK